MIQESQDNCSTSRINDICFPVPLGSIPELPAESCHEIKASEGGQAVSGTYWFYSIVPDKVALAYCDMKTEGNFTFKMSFLCPAVLRRPVTYNFCSNTILDIYFFDYHRFSIDMCLPPISYIMTSYV